MSVKIRHENLNSQALSALDRTLFTGLGQHVLGDFYGCHCIPQTADALEQLMLSTAGIIEATVVTSSFHEFSPQGLSGVVVIAESHLAAHTWPEHGTVCVDLFTCSQEMDPMPGLVYLFETLNANSMDLAITDRGRGIQPN